MAARRCYGARVGRPDDAFPQPVLPHAQWSCWPRRSCWAAPRSCSSCGIGVRDELPRCVRAKLVDLPHGFICSQLGNIRLATEVAEELGVGCKSGAMCAGAHLPSSRASPNGSVRYGAGAHLPSLRASLNSSVRCGGGWHCRCTPSIVAGESEWLRELWRQLALPLRASYRLWRVRRLCEVWWRLAPPVRASYLRGRVRTAP